MNKNHLWIGSIALVLGGAIYILLRPETYVAQLFPQAPILAQMRSKFGGDEWNFIKFYFADYLWGLSFCCFLHLIFQPQRKGSLLCALGTAVYGTLLELLQYFGLISGTGDLLDVLMFISAAATALIINQRTENIEK